MSKTIFYPLLAVALVLIFCAPALAGQETGGFDGHKWGDLQPKDFTVLFEQTYQGKSFALCTDPKADPVYNGFKFDNLMFRYVDGKLAGISFTVKGGKEKYEQAVAAVAATRGEPSATHELKTDGVLQVFWNGSKNSMCLEFTKHQEQGEQDSIALNIAPAIKLGRVRK